MKERLDKSSAKDQVRDWIADDLRECTAFGREHGVIIGVQNHGDFLRTADDLIKLVAMVDSPWCGAIVDTGYFRAPDPYVEMEKAAPYPGAEPWSIAGVSPAELAYINSDPAQPVTKILWSRLLGHRQTWAFVGGKVMTDPICWFYLYWLPGFLNARFGLTITKMGLPLLVIYNGCTFGSIFGGWLPARFIAMGWIVNRARKTAMLLYATAITPIMLVGRVHTLWQAVALISLATAAHQAWSANLFTLASDMFPRRAVASAVGIGACGGSVAMMFFGLFIGFVLQITNGNYVPVFFFAGSAYLIAIGIIHLLAPKLSVVAIDTPRSGLTMRV